MKPEVDCCDVIHRRLCGSRLIILRSMCVGLLYSNAMSVCRMSLGKCLVNLISYSSLSLWYGWGLGLGLAPPYSEVLAPETGVCRWSRCANTRFSIHKIDCIPVALDEDSLGSARSSGFSNSVNVDLQIQPIICAHVWSRFRRAETSLQV